MDHGAQSKETCQMANIKDVKTVFPILTEAKS